jgi:hypothetical protein
MLQSLDAALEAILENFYREIFGEALYYYRTEPIQVPALADPKRPHPEAPNVRAPGLRKQKCRQCIYCGATDKLTKEHLLPKSVGGTITARACKSCNHARGNSGTWRPFRAYIAAHPTKWHEAVLACKQREKLPAWLLANDLVHGR